MSVLLITLPMLFAARLPDPPDAVAEVTVADETGSVTVQLRLERCWPGKGLAGEGDPSLHQDPLHTGLKPDLERRPGSEVCLWLGYRPSAHEERGDTLLTYALLVEQQGEALTGLWYEDHQEVPRTYYRAEGTLSGSGLTLALTGTDGAGPATLTGVVTRSP